MDALIVKTDSSLTVKDSDGNSLGGMSNINTTGTTTQVSEISLPISCKTFYGNGSFYTYPNDFVDAVWAYMNNGVPSNYWNGNVSAVAMAYVLEWDGTGNYTYVSRPVVMKLWKVKDSQQSDGFYTKMSFYYVDNQEVNVTPTLEQKPFAWVFDENGQSAPVSSISSLHAYPQPMVTNVTIQGSVSGGEVLFANGGSWGDDFKNSKINRSTLVITVLKCTNTN